MLSERFFDILTGASGWVVEKSRQALARCNSLSGRTLLAAFDLGCSLRVHVRRGCSHLALVRPVLCGQDEGAHSALN